MIYAGGDSVDTTGLGVIAPKDVQAGHEYIWEYWTPAIGFAVISADTIREWIAGILNWEEYIKTKFPTVGPPPVKITGIAIDDKTGNIWIRGTVLAVPVSDVEQAGVNPLTVFAIIGLVFSAIGLAISVRFVYDLSKGVQTQLTPALDPCNNPGIINYIQCLAQETRWFLFGAFFAITALVVFLLVRFGPKKLT
jgi:hypothetical protein